MASSVSSRAGSGITNPVYLMGVGQPFSKSTQSVPGSYAESRVVDAVLGRTLQTNNMTSEGILTITHCGEKDSADANITLLAPGNNPFGKVKRGETFTFRLFPGANINVRSDGTGDNPRFAATITED